MSSQTEPGQCPGRKIIWRILSVPVHCQFSLAFSCICRRPHDNPSRAGRMWWPAGRFVHHCSMETISRGASSTVFGTFRQLMSNSKRHSNSTGVLQLCTDKPASHPGTTSVTDKTRTEQTRMEKKCSICRRACTGGQQLT